MAGGYRSREILKLVHPGGIKEIHRKPIKACEVMKKYPRHCVTRPDVFKFPWILVHPDSFLKPGGVFYVVPNHTLHCLRRRVKPEKPDASSGKKSFSRENEFQFLRPGNRAMMSGYDFLEERSPVVSGTRAKIDCKFEDWQGNDIFPSCLLSPEIRKKSPFEFILDGGGSSEKSWKHKYCIKDRQESKLERSDDETDSPEKPYKPLKDLFELEGTKEEHEVKHQNRVSFNSPQEHKQESPMMSDRVEKLKNKQRIVSSHRKWYPLEGWCGALNFRNYQEAMKQSQQKSRLKSNKLLQHHGDSPKDVYMIKPVKPFSSGQNHDQREKNSTFGPVKSRSPAFSSDSVSAVDEKGFSPSRADGVCPSISSDKDVRTLKSCLKKNSARSRGLRVKFVLPGEDEKKLRVHVFHYESADSDSSIS